MVCDADMGVYKYYYYCSYYKYPEEKRLRRVEENDPKEEVKERGKGKERRIGITKKGERERRRKGGERKLEREGGGKKGRK